MAMFSPTDTHDYSRDYTPERSYMVTTPTERIDMSVCADNHKAQPIITRTN